METKLSERDLASALPEVPNRVRCGERFVIERDGLQIAVLTPPPLEPMNGIKGLDLTNRLGDLRMPGDGYADDIEAARAALLPAATPQWPD